METGKKGRKIFETKENEKKRKGKYLRRNILTKKEKEKKNGKGKKNF